MEDVSIESLIALAGTILQRSPLSAAKIAAIDEVAGDVSGRRYYRLKLQGVALKSVILMRLHHGSGPLGGGVKKLTQDDTFVELSAFLSKHGIKAPKIIVDARKDSHLIVEDVGSVSLWNIARNEFNCEVEEICRNIGSDYLSELYRRAIGVIKTLQAIRADSSCVAFQRNVPFEQYKKEACEFIDHYANPKGLRRSEREVIDAFCSALCESLGAHPKVLSHFDFTSHNLFISPEGEIRVLDFQDASLVSPVRDIVSLINDRDIDSALGKSRHAALLCYFQEQLRLGAKFRTWYNEYLMHWDMRVSGRFMFLSAQKPNYAQWVPGTLRRIGRTLARMERAFHGMDDVLAILTGLSPEIEEGCQDPWPFDAKLC